MAFALPADPKLGARGEPSSVLTPSVHEEFRTNQRLLRDGLTVLMIEVNAERP